MSYKINSSGKEANKNSSEFTNKQQVSLMYLNNHSNRYVSAREIALHYGYPSGHFSCMNLSLSLFLSIP